MKDPVGQGGLLCLYTGGFCQHAHIQMSLMPLGDAVIMETIFSPSKWCLDIYDKGVSKAGFICFPIMPHYSRVPHFPTKDTSLEAHCMLLPVYQ